MSVNLLDPNLSHEEVSDDLLQREFENPIRYSKRSLYPLMAKRADNNLAIREMLFALILDEQARKQIEMGIVTHAWLPAIFILKHSNLHVKSELKNVLRKWSKEEKELFLIYIRKEKEYYDLLSDIV